MSCFIRSLTILGLLLTGPLSANDDTVDPNLIAALKQAVQETSSFSNKLNAVTWLADMSQRLRDVIPEPFYRVALLKMIHAEATRAELKPELVLALIEVESSFNRFAVSRSGARGLMQVMPFWKKEIGHPLDDLFDPQTNLRYGCTILKYYLDYTDGDVSEALAHYNGSFGQVNYPTKVLLALNETWRPITYERLFNESRTQ